ncbi:DUF2271 domain-containing protein [Mucilaginibacter myungsuensis]|uniref:DUF2271 domain-containing protein n=1 Tax=Mucilaginibacter myungsuensis TaxID=649104 RepID=A0A929L0F3_9SPHI|nr:DUF2271 domain-containing protein [Mucilaginibacter myungsuensis]MBE9663838.1 DUF2271 domain-containing protein [Mucilaginibacter myungsuensis]MDN3598447.1 DUF2271 domain-containing protein [Mucilaginibacter myungsuensis]
MNRFFKVSLLLMALIFAASTRSSAQTTKYKCMIQMTNYMGDGAYIVISLVDPKGEYEKTLYVLGDDKKWYKSMKEWYKFHTKKPSNLSAITGASVTGGDRSVNTIEIETAKLNAGYTLRFESAVEDKPYHIKDVEIPLTTEALGAKTDGDKGYIRYVRFSAN